MSKKSTKKVEDRHPVKRIAIDIAGFGLMIIAPFLGWLPGPGGIPLFLAGLGLVATNHEWAENLLKDFDRRRVEFTEKYLMASPRVSIAIDIIATTLFCIGLYLSFTQTELIYRGIGLFLVSIMLIILLSNQKRFERISSSIKQRFGK